MSQEFRVTFEPSGRPVYVLPGTTLFEAAGRAGLVLQSPCGGRGTCGKCAVRVMGDGEACPATDACRRGLGTERVALGYRLACQARVRGNCVVDVPPAALFESTSKILTSAVGRAVDLHPCVRKTYVELPSPTKEDDAADVQRLRRVAGPFACSLSVLRELPMALRQAGFRGTAVVCDEELVAFEPGDTSGRCFGVAFDLGTTTLVATLVDLVNGRDVAVAACLNPQVAFGDDVITRILRVRERPAALEEMRRAVAEALDGLVGQVAAEGGVARAEIADFALAGNTTMQHIFCGITPYALGELPFTPAFDEGLRLVARDLGLVGHPHARLYVFPNIGGFVGGDTVAGIVATGVHETDRPVLFVDIGTNGEIVIAHDGQMLAASTAAGPAFEGARIAAGMRATDGAIEKVVRGDADIACNVIGNSRPAGLCGTALIDLAAELLRYGVIDPTGRVLGPSEVPGTVPPAVRDRLETRGDEVRFRIVSGAESRTGEPIFLTQRDVRELQLATGAIRAGVSILLQRVGLAPGDLSAVLLAGGFGNFIRRRNARRLGLLPQIPTDRLRFVGNSSSLGAKAALMSREARQTAERVAGQVQHVDLSLDPDFQLEFGMAMMFPEDEPHTE